MQCAQSSTIYCKGHRDTSLLQIGNKARKHHRVSEIAYSSRLPTTYGPRAWKNKHPTLKQTGTMQ
jgi:hypothetical protein